MKLFRVTLTGADDQTDPEDLARLSDQYPFVEWGILLSEGRAGKARYPSRDWLRSLGAVQCINEPKLPLNSAPMNLSAHLCGATMRAFTKGITFDHFDEGAWAAQHGLTETDFNRMFQRCQVNANIPREGLSPDDLRAILSGWYESMDGALITQHNAANADAWKTLQASELTSSGVLRAHQILHDASGGRGQTPERWDRPIAGVLNGYAGGIKPETVIETLEELETIVGEGYVWIDMESSLRDADDRFDITRAQTVLDTIASQAPDRDWL